jgi:GT2 family glycosyltransferase
MINYVIAAWAGTRRTKDLIYESDRACYLRDHLQQLKKLKHNLDQITIVIAETKEDRPEFTQYIDSIRDEYVIIERGNYGQSYGSWSKAYEIYKDKFDYYFFLEDDYVFMMDDFDSLLVKDFEKIENCGYLCSKVGESAEGIKHASMSIGVCSSEACAKVWDEFGWLPHPMDSKYCVFPQISFSKAFIEIGYELQDLSEDYSLPFADTCSVTGKMEFLDMGNPDKPCLIAPIQFLKESNG